MDDTNDHLTRRPDRTREKLDEKGRPLPRQAPKPTGFRGTLVETFYTRPTVGGWVRSIATIRDVRGKLYVHVKDRNEAENRESRFNIFSRGSKLLRLAIAMSLHSDNVIGPELDFGNYQPNRMSVELRCIHGEPGVTLFRYLPDEVRSQKTQKKHLLGVEILSAFDKALSTISTASPEFAAFINERQYR
jgi:hypothetical protein